MLAGMTDEEISTRLEQMRRFKEDLERSNAKMASQNERLRQGLIELEGDEKPGAHIRKIGGEPQITLYNAH